MVLVCVLLLWNDLFYQDNKYGVERQNRNHSFMTLSKHKMQLRSLE